MQAFVSSGSLKNFGKNMTFMLVDCSKLLFCLVSYDFYRLDIKLDPSFDAIVHLLFWLFLNLYAPVFIFIFNFCFFVT